MIRQFLLTTSLLLTSLPLMSATASGTFTVNMVPTATTNEATKAISGMQLSKVYTGDLAGTGEGHMLMERTATKGSAGYVALELVTATLGQKSGTFLLQHSGTMDKGDPSLSVTVVPDSGTQSLVGLAGAMTIEVNDGGHHYSFDYTLPE